MKGKSWSSNVGGWMVVSIWNCQCCKMLIGPPAGNELNRVGSGYFRWILAAAWKQPAWLAGGFSSGSCSLNAPGLLQGYMYAVMPFGLSESHMDRQLQSSESWTFMGWTMQLPFHHRQSVTLLQKARAREIQSFCICGQKAVFCSPLWWVPA